jgi:hypothetical protein
MEVSGGADIHDIVVLEMYISMYYMYITMECVSCIEKNVKFLGLIRCMAPEGILHHSSRFMNTYMNRCSS